MVVVAAREDEAFGKGQDSSDARLVQFTVLPKELCCVVGGGSVGALQNDVIAAREDLRCV